MCIFQDAKLVALYAKNRHAVKSFLLKMMLALLFMFY